MLLQRKLFLIFGCCPEFKNTDQRVQFYKSYVQPNVDYCSAIWQELLEENLIGSTDYKKELVKVL